MKTLSTEIIEKICNIDLSIDRLGECSLTSPLSTHTDHLTFVDDSERVSLFANTSNLSSILDEKLNLPSFMQAGPREKIYHDPSWSRAAIVTCGGLCPGLNDVVKALVNCLYYNYGVDNIYGIRYGYRGMISKYKLDPIILNPEVVDTIHEKGGTVLGSSRGFQDPEEIVRFLDRQNINMLFTIGGDGTQRGTRDIANIIKKRGLSISVIGIPKTIDNDLNLTERTFGFQTAVQAAVPVIRSAHDEANGAYNGIGLVKLMGRDSGFITANASLASSVVNFCLIPEEQFTLEGDNGLFYALEQRLANKHHAVIVVAEGAGQELIKSEEVRKDASGNILHEDIGVFLKQKISEYFKQKGIDCTIKYFDPSYQIRSITANADDSVFCQLLAQNAVHAAMAGMTNMVVGYWHGQYTYIPVELAVAERRKVDPNSQLWQSVLQATRQGRHLKTTRPTGTYSTNL